MTYDVVMYDVVGPTITSSNRIFMQNHQIFSQTPNFLQTVKSEESAYFDAGYHSAVVGMTRPAHVRNPASSKIYLVTSSWLTQIFQQCCTNSSCAFSVNSHAACGTCPYPWAGRIQDCTAWPNDCKLCFIGSNLHPIALIWVSLN